MSRNNRTNFYNHERVPTATNQVWIEFKLANIKRVVKQTSLFIKVLPLTVYR
jgi:hypothetical protein